MVKRSACRSIYSLKLLSKMKSKETNHFSDEGGLCGQSANRPSSCDSHLGLAVDLGLPSGTRWALCNLGANMPEEFGDHYAWGETEVKDYYGWDSHACQGKERPWPHEPSMCFELSDRDVVRVKWGFNWRMPTLVQMQELLLLCSFVWTEWRGVPGGEFTSKLNGRSIFLPAAGYHWFDHHGCAGTSGCYWTSTQGSTNPHFASSLTFYAGCAYCEGDNCRGGFSVRPVLVS